MLVSVAAINVTAVDAALTEAAPLVGLGILIVSPFLPLKDIFLNTFAATKCFLYAATTSSDHISGMKVAAVVTVTAGVGYAM